ncbi:phosphate signaling complex protein PhoU [Salipaludibacillus agaradhaerens]|uniref:Phosphate-specific transport system accessory protein PhoU n=1 Tax=Salipaludibacillus agaradhaerens TaxID=76935 RepID=A0A9Q4B050_SALAG|nr:phosphate signaling complex protein PhoU [Salipaludibacillus agaradhaerens]MCR6095681.1 phosphate signaling complex protein PhoU [Salipaludibacillus agaradhaerens]MCR6114759.1 phosphate signaling complex protein PhoU [Salipaludibacillus agaradhaerens]
MPTRETFETNLAELKEDIMFLGTMVEKAFEATIDAVVHADEGKFDDIISNDKYINELELEINEKATLLIAKQQPVASDLRKIIVTLKVSSDLERMGDLTVDMAKAAKRIEDREKVDNYMEDLLAMAEKAQDMLRKVLAAYRASDVIKAQLIASLDDEIDAAYGDFVQSIFKMAIAGHDSPEYITQMAFISRYIERIADYSTNIAEWIVYEVNGQRFDLN